VLPIIITIKEEFMGAGKKRILMVFVGLAGALGLFLFASRAFAAKMDRSAIAPIPGAVYSGTESCAPCHPKESEEFANNPHAKYAADAKDAKSEGCEVCHGPGSKHIEDPQAKDAIYNPKKNPEMCYQCHANTKAEFNLQYHHPVKEGKMSCQDCHSVHGEEAVPGVQSMELEGQDATCLKCHPNLKGPFVYEHDAMKEGCSVCHTPHGSVSKKLLTARDQNLCFKCHFEQIYPKVGAQTHGTGSPVLGPALSARGKESCMDCHTAIHGSNFDYGFTTE
jgi:predicted CXXCH cytochrome family protein